MKAISPRFSLLDFIDSVPLPEAEKRVHRSFLEYCYGVGKPLGEHYASLVADYLGMAESIHINNLHRLSVYLRAFTVVDNDLRDIPVREFESTMISLRDFFREQARREAEMLSSDTVNATKIFDAEITTYIIAADLYDNTKSEVRADGVEKTYIEEYVDRMAVIRIPFLILASHSGDEELLASGCRAINSLIKALGILDDLVDWEEDLRAGRFTYPVLCYLSKIPTADAERIASFVHNSGSIGLVQAIEALDPCLPYHPVVPELLEIACDLLYITMINLAKGLGSRFLNTAVNIRKRVDWVLSEYGSQEVEGAHEVNWITRLKHSTAGPVRLQQERLY